MDLPAVHVPKAVHTFGGEQGGIVSYKVQKPRSIEQGFVGTILVSLITYLEFEGNTRHKVGWLLWRTIVIPIPLVGQVITLQ